MKGFASYPSDLNALVAACTDSSGVCGIGRLTGTGTMVSTVLCQDGRTVRQEQAISMVNTPLGFPAQINEINRSTYVDPDTVRLRGYGWFDFRPAKCGPGPVQVINAGIKNVLLTLASSITGGAVYPTTNFSIGRVPVDIKSGVSG